MERNRNSSAVCLSQEGYINPRTLTGGNGSKEPPFRGNSTAFEENDPSLSYDRVCVTPIKDLIEFVYREKTPSLN